MKSFFAVNICHVILRVVGRCFRNSGLFRFVSRIVNDIRYFVKQTSSSVATGYYTSTVLKTPLPGSLRAGYHNSAFLSSELNLRQMQQHHETSVLAAAAATSTAAESRQRVQRLVGLHR